MVAKSAPPYYVVGTDNWGERCMTPSPSQPIMSYVGLTFEARIKALAERKPAT